MAEISYGKRTLIASGPKEFSEGVYGVKYIRVRGTNVEAGCMDDNKYTLQAQSIAWNKREFRETWPSREDLIPKI